MNPRFFLPVITAPLFLAGLYSANGFPQESKKTSARDFVIEMKATMSDEKPSPGSGNGLSSGLISQNLSLTAQEPIQATTMMRNQQGDGFAYAIFNEASKGCLGPVSSRNGFIDDDTALRTTRCYLTGDGGLLNSLNPFSQFFYFTDQGQFQSASRYGFCLEVASGVYENNQPVVFKRCNSEQLAQRYIYDSNTGQIKPTANTSYCLAISGKSNHRESPVVIWECTPNDPDQRWQIATSSVARIRNKARGNYVAVGSDDVTADKGLITWPSTMTDRWQDQFWVFDQYVNDEKKSTLKVLSPFADVGLCAENNNGGPFKIRNGDQFGLYSCNPEQRQDQQLVLTDGAFDPAGWGNIYINGNSEHNVGISGSENNAGAGLIFWAADSSEIDQKFRVDIGTGIFALYNDNYDLCVSAPYASTSENIHSMPCSLSVAGNPYHQFFEAYKDSRNNYVFAVMRDNNLCLHADNIFPRVTLESCPDKEALDDNFKWKLAANGSLQSVKRGLCLDIGNNSGGVTTLEECSNTYGQHLAAMKAPIPNAGAFKPEYLCKKNTRPDDSSSGLNALPHQYRQTFNTLVNEVEANGLNAHLIDLFKMIYQTDNRYYLEEIMTILTQLGYSDDEKNQGGAMLRTIQQALLTRKSAIANISNSHFGRRYSWRFGKHANPYESYGVATMDDEDFAVGILEFAKRTIIPLQYMLLNMNGITNINRGITANEVDRLTRLADLAQRFASIQADIAFYTDMLRIRKDYAMAVKEIHNNILEGKEQRAEPPTRETLQDEPDCE